MNNVSNNRIYYSLFIIIFFGTFTDVNTQLLYFKFEETSIYKFFFNFYIYLSLYFLPLKNLNKLDNFFEKKVKFLYLLLLAYGLIIIFTSINSLSSIVNIFGNPTFGPIFFTIFFLLWGTQINCLFLFNKLCLLSVYAALVITFLSMIFGFDPAINLFLPLFYLIITLNYQITSSKILIFISIFVSIYIFYTLGYRIGLVMLGFSSLILLVSLFKNKTLFYFFILFFVLSPIILFILFINYEFNLFEFMTNLFAQESALSLDTRSFIYLEFFNQLNTKELIFGKGVLGTYYSNYFYLYRDVGGDHFDRVGVEIGFLHYILKGGAIYFIIYYLFLGFICLKRYKSNYFSSIAMFISIFLSLLFVENQSFFSVKIILIWILVSFCASKLFNSLTDEEIKKKITNLN